MPSQNLPKPNLPKTPIPSVPTAGMPNPSLHQASMPANQAMPGKTPSMPTMMPHHVQPQQNNSRPPVPQPHLQPKTPTQPSVVTGQATSQQRTASFSSSASQPSQTPQTPPPLMRTPQAIPGGLSRENPGGTPPGLKATAQAANIPPLSLSNTRTAAQPTLSTPLPTPQMQSTQSASSSGVAKPLSLSSNHPVEASRPGQLNTAATQKNAGIKTAQPLAVGKFAPAAAPVVAASNGGNGVGKPPVSATPSSAAAPVNKKRASLPKPLLFALLAVILLAIVGAVAAFFLKPNTTTPTTKSNGTNSTKNATTTPSVTLTYWGLWEDSQVLSEVIADYESQNPNVKIDYRKQSPTDYRERLQQAIDSGNGPDIFRYHATWVPMLGGDLAALPATVMSSTEFKTTFYPVAFEQLQYNGQLVGIPLMYDGLALLYNKEMLKTANISVPTTWSDLRDAASKLTVPADTAARSDENITRAGLAIGNAGNVDHFSDILALLILQNGGKPSDPTSQNVNDALTFYTNFMKRDKVWSSRLPNSTLAFARGDVAMIFAPSWRILDIKNANPQLDFGVAPVPQLDSQSPVTWATFWAEGVSSKSKNQTEAWKFLKYLSSQDVLKKFYASASKSRTFGEIYPRQDMASQLASDPLVGAYITDAPKASSWYMASFTHDNGLDDQIIKYYEDAITSILSSGSVGDAVKTLGTAIPQVLAKYNIK